MNRREWLAASSLALGGLALGGRASARGPERFDYAALKGRARALAAREYAAPARSVPPAVAHLSWDRYVSIRYRRERALWSGSKLPFRIEFFHLGMQYRRPVAMHEVVDGVARPIGYDPAMFDLSSTGLDAKRLPHDLGFAGFKLFAAPDFERDVAAFLGASYFRAVGATKQYGLSARGLAIDTGLARAEEFPDFVAFWFERPTADAKTLTVYALLDSPSVAGAYRFVITPGAPLAMRIDAALYPRRAIERLGIAPATSMFLTGSNDRRIHDDWRWSIHDSDGLSMWRGNGEWIWRPLTNPAELAFNAYADSKPHGFGLMQRDRNFDHYQDDGVFYDRRPSLWTEPHQGFDEGAVDLVEIPIAHESFDNIVAFWNPKTAAKPGAELLYAYTLYWGEKMPASPPLGHVAETWTGIGGQVGGDRDHFSWRFVVDFAGGALGGLGADAGVEPVITASRGTIEVPSARPLASIDGYRAMFDLRPPEDGGDPIDIRLYLRRHGEALTETWLYQWRPPQRRD